MFLNVPTGILKYSAASFVENQRFWVGSSTIFLSKNSLLVGCISSLFSSHNEGISSPVGLKLTSFGGLEPDKTNGLFWPLVYGFLFTIFSSVTSRNWTFYWLRGTCARNCVTNHSEPYFTYQSLEWGEVSLFGGSLSWGMIEDMQPIQFQVFDWTQDDTFFSKLEDKWDISFDTYRILECLTRQAFFRFTGYTFFSERLEPNIEIKNFRDPHDYIYAIQNYIKETENKNRNHYKRAIELTNSLNEMRKKGCTTDDALELYGKFGPLENDPLILIGKFEEGGVRPIPNVFLEYGREKLVFWKILRDVEGLPIAETDLEEDQQFGGPTEKQFKQARKQFGSTRTPGRYVESFEMDASSKIEIHLHPDRHESFKFLLGAYYSVFHSYWIYGNKNTPDYRTGFDAFVAAKLEYMTKDASKNLEKMGFDTRTLYQRETIKDRIAKNIEVYERGKAEIGDHLLNDDLIEYLIRRI